MEKLIATGVMFGICGVLVATFFFLNKVLGPNSRNIVKNTPFETGRAPITLTGHRMTIKFYMIAILFVLFDIEMIFFYPWAVVFREIGMVGLVSMALFVAVLVLGLAYAWKKGAFVWE